MMNFLNLNGFVREADDLKLLIIDGDYFDSKITFSDPAGFYAMLFFNEILTICKEKGITMRMIQGTRSHDLNQLQVFKCHETDPDLDFRVIEAVEREELFGLKLLYLPEEYPQNSEEYYADYKSSESYYNIIFGHGTWDFVAQQGLLEKSLKTDVCSAPVFIWKEWKHTVPNGFVSFGHIHGRNTYGKRIFYSGSFTRWGFNEISPRGFTYFTYDTDNEKYEVNYIDNVLAPDYQNYSVSDALLLESDAPKIQEEIEKQLEKVDFLKVDLSGLSSEKIEILRKTFAKNPNIKIEVKTKTKALLKESENVIEFSKYHYITKRQLPINQMVQRFCKEEMLKDLSIEDIDRILKP